MVKVTYLEILGGVQGEAVVHPRRQHNQVAFLNFDADPLSVEVTHILITCISETISGKILNQATDNLCLLALLKNLTYTDLYRLPQ